MCRPYIDTVLTLGLVQPCNTVPTVAFQFTRTRAAYQFEVNADNLNLGYLPGDRSRCVGSIVGVDLGLGSSWILGDSFRTRLRSAWSVRRYADVPFGPLRSVGECWRRAFTL